MSRAGAAPGERRPAWNQGPQHLGEGAAETRGGRGSCPGTCVLSGSWTHRFRPEPTPASQGTGRGRETPGSCGQGRRRTQSGIRRRSWEGGVDREVRVTHTEDACPPFLRELSRPRGLPCPGIRVLLGSSAGH